MSKKPLYLALADGMAAQVQRLIGVMPAVLPALCSVGVLFAPYHLGWGCKPTFGSVALVLLWLLPLLGGLRSLFAREIERPVVIVSWALAALAGVVALQGTVVATITTQACR